MTAQTITIDGERTSLLTIAGGDTVIVTETGAILPSSGPCINTMGNGNSLTIDGRVSTGAPNCKAIVLSDGSVHVGSNGQVFGSDYGLSFSGSSASVTNDGTIKSDNCAISAAPLALTNTNLIEGGQIGVQSSGFGQYRLFLTNSGAIKGGLCAILAGSANDIVTNTGHLEGQKAVMLQDGADIYDGRNGGTAAGCIDLGSGDDMAYGGAGNETLLGGAGADRLDGGGGIDRAIYTQSDAAVTVDLGTGKGVGGEAQGDTLIGIEEIEGSAFGDTLTGDDGDWNWISAQGGNDTVRGGGGRDVLGGDAGDDSLDGGAGQDDLYGGTGHDSLAGGADPDHLDGEAGDDSLDGGSGADTLLGKEGDDTLVGGIGNDLIDGGSGTNLAVFAGARAGYSLVKHSDGSITVTGQDGTDQLKNVQFARFDDQTIDLNALALEPSPPSTTPSSGGQDGPSGASAGLVLIGTAGADRLSGGVGHDKIYGLAGNDVLRGNAGNDTLWGGAGKDVLYGGAGQDVFVFHTRPSAKTNLDRIADFSVRDDTLWLDNAVFRTLGKGSAAHPGKLAKGFFTTGEHAKDTNDHLIYDRKTGVLSYDPDGSGAKAAVAVAVLTKGLKLTYHDFLVI